MKIEFIFLILFLLFSCSNNKEELPIYGRKKISERLVDGKLVYDTIEHRISNFSFLNQNGQIVNNKTFEGSVYIADFFLSLIHI